MRHLSGLRSYEGVRLLRTTVCNLIVEGLLPTRGNSLDVTSYRDFYWLRVRFVLRPSTRKFGAGPAICIRNHQARSYRVRGPAIPARNRLTWPPPKRLCKVSFLSETRPREPRKRVYEVHVLPLFCRESVQVSHNKIQWTTLHACRIL